MARDAFPGYDDPVHIEGDPEEVPTALLDDPEPDEAAEPGRSPLEADS